MCRVCWAFVTVLVLLSGGLIYKFVLSGEVKFSADGREAIVLTEPERALVLAEMRTFLDSVQQITKGVANGNMKTVTDAANLVGRGAQQGMPGSLVGKLPLNFKKLGFDTHSKFSQLALDAEQLGDEQHALSQLSELMENCVACHEMFKIEVEMK
ncbi:MAG TPA: hypothetical protein ENJ28_11130 [Gammaproteobacteria bacterium]|nr:hypothetical protein [Gammaproteobacteria bacterium]